MCVEPPHKCATESECLEKLLSMGFAEDDVRLAVAECCAKSITSSCITVEEVVPLLLESANHPLTQTQKVSKQPPLHASNLKILPSTPPLHASRSHLMSTPLSFISADSYLHTSPSHLPFTPLR